MAFHEKRFKQPASHSDPQLHLLAERFPSTHPLRRHIRPPGPSLRGRKRVSEHDSAEPNQPNYELDQAWLSWDAQGGKTALLRQEVQVPVLAAQNLIGLHA